MSIKMPSETVFTFRNDLEEKLSMKRNELATTEETLKKYVGPTLGTALRKRLGPPPQVQGHFDGGPRRSRLSLESRLGPKVNEEEDPEELNVDGRKVDSRVVVDQKTREEALAEQKVDRAEVQRNKRIFGNLLGTLQKFRQDETKIKEREDKKRSIELKIEEKTEKEREEAKTKKMELFTERERKKHELKVLQVQMKRVEEFEIWEKSKRNESLFIRTRTPHSPQIYFLPKEHNKSTQAALQKTLDLVEKEIQDAREKFEEELLKIAAKADNPNQDPEVDDDDDDEEDFKNKSVVSAVQRPIKSKTSPTTKGQDQKRRHRSSDSSANEEKPKTESDQNGVKTKPSDVTIEKTEEEAFIDQPEPIMELEEPQMENSESIPLPPESEDDSKDVVVKNSDKSPIPSEKIKLELIQKPDTKLDLATKLIPKSDSATKSNPKSDSATKSNPKSDSATKSNPKSDSATKSNPRRRKRSSSSSSSSDSSDSSSSDEERNKKSIKKRKRRSSSD